MSATQTASELAYMDAGLPSPSTGWREAIYSVVDLELTGLDPEVHEIVSFASVTVEGGRIRLDDARYRLVRPRRMPGEDTIRIHGLREADLAHAPVLDEVLDELLDALTGKVLVAHVAAIEEGFLSAALERNGLRLRNPVVDTARLGEELRRRRHQSIHAARSEKEPSDFAASSPGLSDLARYLGLPVHRPHHADGDALTAAQVFIALATHLDRLEPQTVGSLEKLSGPVRRGRVPTVLARLRAWLARR